MASISQASLGSIRGISCGLTQSAFHAMTPKLKIRSAISIPKLPSGDLLKNINAQNILFKNTRMVPLEIATSNGHTTKKEVSHEANIATTKLYMILEAVQDRIEMHKNIGEQRENWNSLLLNSLNMVTLTAVTMAGLGEMGGSVLPLKISSTLLFAAATGILLITNKIQPSQLVEEQRNAVRLLKQLQTKIQTTLSLQTPTGKDVEDAMEKVLALDRAYPLPLLGAMLDKFPNTFKPATWWPTKPSQQAHDGVHKSKACYHKNKGKMNGWSEELEEEMRSIVGVMDTRDMEDYVRLGNKALKLNKTLAMLGPSLMGMAAIGSALSGHGGSWGAPLAAMAGSMASIVNTIEHGGQVGMVFEMYRNCAGFFSLLEETVESNLEESDLGKRENGELFEMKMALHLGRSLSELRDFASKSRVN
ncbi:hypothetical protein Cgig2_011252 [Carnegiea gigantea]|uniref:F-box protein n=1 Tax=Carnegiea gigantea TaxID=171969 RepID=A0A9Q1KGA4_9CARY|nr:hypothetical protein Cgig2_011252 [Carnegiea gigantea]